MHLFAIVANNAYLCLVLADEICYGIHRWNWRQKTARQPRPAFTFVDKKGVNYTLCVLTHRNLANFRYVHQHNRSSQRPIYGMNTTHALIVSWRQALCPVVRMLDRVYYIIKVGLHTARFMDKGNAKTSETGTGAIVQAPLFLYPQFRRRYWEMNKSRLL